MDGNFWTISVFVSERGGGLASRRFSLEFWQAIFVVAIIGWYLAVVNRVCLERARDGER